MRIAFISTVLDYPWGGADALWTQAAEAAALRGDELLLAISPLTAAHSRIAALRARGARVVERSAPRYPGHRWSRAWKAFRCRLGSRDPLVAQISGFRPDLIVFSLGGTYDLVLYRSLAAWMLATRVRFRIIANFQHEHPHLVPADLVFTRTLFAAASSVNFVSTRNLEVTRRHLVASLPNARVIQNPLRWRPADVTPWLESPVCLLATVGRLEEVKGLDLLLNALAIAGGDLPDWNLSIYGTGPQEPYLRETAAQAGLGGRVRFRGYVGELRAIWAENQLLCSPARDEGVPMTVPEAMLSARPVLATAVGGAEDWLRDGVTGFLCPAPTVPLLAGTIRRALETRAQWREMGRAAAAEAGARQRPDDYLALIAPDQ